ncbi:VCBS repeat-containing protein [Streptomyces sp. NPDC021608]|uniref:FG-GAP repeat domain-containing protein n=1 Tax=Streptomyces sp. NPDC021608 TaxID=3154903 RepID=UPI0033DCEDB8
MASPRTVRRRLGGSVAAVTVLAVTAGAGVLASPLAVASSAAVGASGAGAALTSPAGTGSVTEGAAVRTAATVPAVTVSNVGAVGSVAGLDVGAEVVSSGDSGYLTSRTDGSGSSVLEWHRYADGSVAAVGAGVVGYDSDSDFVVTGDGGSMVFVRDMRDMRDTGGGAAWSASYDLASEFRPGAKLVGVVGDDLFVKVPADGGVYQELWQLARVDGVVTKTKRSSNPFSMDFKVVASTSDVMIVLSSNRVFPSSSTFRTEYWRTRASVGGDASIESGSRKNTAPWTQASTGAYTADYEAGVEYRGGVTELVVDGTFVHRRFAMDGSMSGAVVVGIVRDTLLYGVPGEASDATPSPLFARSVTDPGAAPYELLRHFSSAAHAPDGSLLVRGATTDADGLFRIREATGGLPGATLIADTGRLAPVQVSKSKVPAAVSLEKPGATVPMEWTLSRANATVDLTLTHTATGRKLTQRLDRPVAGSRFAFLWNGVLDGGSAPNGAYTWQITAGPADGVGSPATAQGSLRVSRRANPHDFSDNGSTDVLARDASGVLWRDDLFDWPSDGKVATAGRTKVGSGWQGYDQLEAVGNVAGASTGDVVARDASGVLWLYQGTGSASAPFAPRVRVGGGWQIYKKITGGGDLTGDGRPDLVAADAAGVLWLYKGTGRTSAPFAPRVRVGGGWQIYHHITAVGDVAGTAAGDLAARDASGVLWLYRGDGAGRFAPRVRIGAGWNAFSRVVGAGDVTADGRPDLIAYGPNGTYVYRATGSTTAPFARLTTTLYAGEGGKFNDVV